MKKDKVGPVTTFALIGLAIPFDCIQIIVMFVPVLDILLDFFIGMTEVIIFGLSLLFLEVEVDPATGLLLAVVEPMPFLGELPLLTPGIWNIIRIANKKYRKEQEAKARIEKEKTAARNESIGRMLQARNAREESMA